jgi:septum formation protein
MTRWIYLASQSPRRRQLLDQIGVRHELLLPGPDEDAEALETVRPNEAPRAYVQRVTLAKLDAARARLQRAGLPTAPILCADTTVALGTPPHADEACEMLGARAGHEHRVLTAVALADGERVLQGLSVSRVRFAPVDAARIAAYVASGEPMGKAGAYAIQSGAATWVERIAGSYSGIMGLPLFETARLLRDAGWSL